MGTWGYEPKDNDGAWDYLYAFDVPVAKVLRKFFKKNFNSTNSRWSRLGLVQMVLERGFAVPLDIYKKALLDLHICSLDKAWLNTWNDPKHIEKSIKLMRTSLTGLGKNILPSRPKRGHKIGRPALVLAPNGWPKRTWSDSGPSRTAP